MMEASNGKCRMNLLFSHPKRSLWIAPFLLLSSCHHADTGASASDNAGNPTHNMANEENAQNSDSSTQVADYVVEISEDRKGNLWFGTMSKGVARYDGKVLTYITTKAGLAGNTVSSIIEDKEGNLWFGTHSGVSKYDGKTFTNFTTKEGLTNNRTTRILSDRDGNIWVSSFDGVCRYNGTFFHTFRIPNPETTSPIHLPNQQWIRDMI